LPETGNWQFVYEVSNGLRKEATWDDSARKLVKEKDDKKKIYKFGQQDLKDAGWRYVPEYDKRREK